MVSILVAVIAVLVALFVGFVTGAVLMLTGEPSEDSGRPKHLDKDGF